MVLSPFHCTPFSLKMSISRTQAEIFEISALKQIILGIFLR